MLMPSIEMWGEFPKGVVAKEFKMCANVWGTHTFAFDATPAVSQFCTITWWQTTLPTTELKGGEFYGNWVGRLQLSQWRTACVWDFPIHLLIQNVSLNSPGAPPLPPPPSLPPPPPSDHCHLCIVCVQRDCSRHPPPPSSLLWLAFTQCNQCCSCLKRPLVRHLSNGRFPRCASATFCSSLHSSPRWQTANCLPSMCQATWFTSLFDSGRPFPLFFLSAPFRHLWPHCIGKNCHGRKLEILIYRRGRRIVPVCVRVSWCAPSGQKLAYPPHLSVFWTRMKWLTGELFKIKFGFWLYKFSFTIWN